MPRTRIVNAPQDQVLAAIKKYQENVDENMEIEFITGRGKDICQVFGFIDSTLVKMVMEFTPDCIRMYGYDEDKTSKTIAEIPKDNLEYYRYDSKEDSVRVCLRTKKLVSVSKSIAGIVVLHFSIKRGDHSSIYFKSDDNSTDFMAIDKLEPMEMPVDVEDANDGMEDAKLEAYVELDSIKFMPQLARITTESATIIVKRQEIFIKCQDGNDTKTIVGSVGAGVKFIQKHVSSKVGFTFIVKKVIQLLKGLSTAKTNSDVITMKFFSGKPLVIEYAIANMANIKIMVNDNEIKPIKAADEEKKDPQ